MRVHELKCWPIYFQLILTAEKRCELRSEADRVFLAGDFLRLREFDFGAGRYTANCTCVRVTDVLREHAGIAPGFALLSVEAVSEFESDLVAQATVLAPLPVGSVEALVAPAAKLPAPKRRRMAAKKRKAKKRGR
jgi:hypothetical protein